MLETLTIRLREEALARTELLQVGPLVLRSSLARSWVTRAVAYLSRAGLVSSERLASAMGMLEVQHEPDWTRLGEEIATWPQDVSPLTARAVVVELLLLVIGTSGGESPELVNCMRIVLGAADLVGQLPIEVHRLAAEVSEAAAAQGALGLGLSSKVSQ